MTHKHHHERTVKQVAPENVKPATAHRLWFAFIAVLVASVVAQFWVHPHGYFAMDDSFWFYPVCGLISAMALVLLSRFVGLFLKRPETYWNEEERHD